MAEISIAEHKRAYYHRKHRALMFAILFAVLTVAAFFVSLTVGFYEISITECYQVLVDHITGNITDPKADSIVWGSRLPIALFAIIAGAALSVGGAVMQTTVRNPLADPYTMGISSGATLGASLCIIAGVNIWSGFDSEQSLIVMAFLFSLIPVSIIMIFSSKKNTTPSKMILIGIAVMYLFSAATTLLKLSATEDTLADVYMWTVGSLALVDWSCLPVAFASTVLCMAVLLLNSRKINVMMTGPNTVQSLGVDSRKYMLFLLVVVSLMTASVVCFCGPIGFIGLVGPHVARIFVGSETKYLIPASASIGAFFLLVANSVASVAGTYGLPVGVISALIGCPLFIFILVKMRRKVWM